MPCTEDSIADIKNSSVSQCFTKEFTVSKINKHALGEYTESAYQKLHKKVGDSGLKAIQEHDQDSANIIAKLSECDEVVYVGYSEVKSNFPKTIASFVDCKNGKRFYVINRQVEK